MQQRYRTPLLGTIALLGLGCLISTPLQAEASDSASPDIPVEWNLGDLYSDKESWEQAFGDIQNRIDGLGRFKDNLTKNPQRLGEALDSVSHTRRELARLMAYASLMSDQDLRQSGPQEMVSRAAQLAAEMGRVTGYIDPALARMDSEQLRSWMNEPELKNHRRHIEEIIRSAAHILSPDTESALAALSPVLTTSTTYSLLANSDIDWPSLTVEGEKVRLDQSGYSRLRESLDRETRRKVFNTFWPVWQQYESTFGSLLSNQVQAQVTEARLRNYDSALDAAVSANDIPVEVYHQLIESTNSHLSTLHRYLKLRERILGLDQLHYYDIYPPLVENDVEFSIEQARQLAVETARPLGDDYVALLAEATASPWTSLYPARGKRSGAYMMGSAYDVHPYVLMNYNNSYGDVSTYAHEWGHGMHSLLANAAQPYETSDYSIFTAEVASIVNETLMVNHMIESATSDEMKLFYIGQALESIRGTFFRQTQFAEFELAIHEAVENGEALSGERLTAMYANILEKYYGVEQGVTVIDPKFFIEWAYIPHFYYNFYVYQYATSITAANMLADRLAHNEPGMPENYLAVLKAGGVDSGYRLLKEAGVDVATEEPYRHLMVYSENLMDQAEQILDAMETSQN